MGILKVEKRHQLAIEVECMGTNDLQYQVRKSEIATNAKEAERKGTWRSEEKKNIPIE
jgi:hypothetical protein